jgi:hypothetical protein
MHAIKPDWLGSFPGDGLREDQLDAMLAFSLQPGDIEAARSLHETKWWDYRFIHPGFCFFLFAHEYGKAVTRWRSMFGVNPDVVLTATDNPIFRNETRRHGRNIVQTGKKLLSPPAYRTSMWRAMCFADAYGVPYSRWIGLAFEFAFEFKWERMPQPSGLYGDSMAKWVIERWEREKADILHLPNDPRYLPENDQGHRWQKAQQDWLVDLIRRRPLPHIPLAQYMCREDRIDVDLALNALGRDTVERALASASATS